jgi:hypothetical protein
MPEKECKEAWQENHGARHKIRGAGCPSAQATRGALDMRNACSGEKGELVSGKPVFFQRQTREGLGLRVERESIVSSVQG